MLLIISMRLIEVRRGGRQKASARIGRCDQRDGVGIFVRAQIVYNHAVARP